MTQAILKINNKQYIVRKGDVILIDYIKNSHKKTIIFNSILAIIDNQKKYIGNPYVAKYYIEAEIILSKIKGNKILVFKKKRRKGYRKKIGHRQIYTNIKINKIYKQEV